MDTNRNLSRAWIDGWGLLLACYGCLAHLGDLSWCSRAQTSHSLEATGGPVAAGLTSDATVMCRTRRIQPAEDSPSYVPFICTSMQAVAPVFAVQHATDRCICM